MSRTISVGLGERAYDVVVGEGLLDVAGRLIAPFQKRGRTAVVSDETVWGLHGARLFTGSWSGWVEDPTRPVATGTG